MRDGKRESVRWLPNVSHTECVRVGMSVLHPFTP